MDVDLLCEVLALLPLVLGFLELLGSAFFSELEEEGYHVVPVLSVGALVLVEEILEVDLEFPYLLALRIQKLQKQLRLGLRKTRDHIHKELVVQDLKLMGLHLDGFEALLIDPLLT